MEEKSLKGAAVFLLLLTVLSCVGINYFPQLNKWASEKREEREAEAEAAETRTEMSNLEIVETDEPGEEEGMPGQLRLRLPDGVDADDITITENYVTQKVQIEIPGADQVYFNSYPVSGSSDHIDDLSYTTAGGGGMIEITMDQVYELDIAQKETYYYFNFLTPQEVYDKVVVIDAGHGGEDPGNVKQGAQEKDINLAIVLELKKLLDEDEHNIGVYYTRTDDTNPTYKQRAGLANKTDANLFISVHNNSTNSKRMSNASGTLVMYDEEDETLQSKNLAQICQEEVTAVLDSHDRGLMEGHSIYIIRSSQVPVALIEVGFMSNQTELNLLETEEYQAKTAEGIYNAILRALEEGY
jgi:N-acetylmuramoyl-L-alanine amidase